MTTCHVCKRALLDHGVRVVERLGASAYASPVPSLGDVVGTLECVDVLVCDYACAHRLDRLVHRWNSAEELALEERLEAARIERAHACFRETWQQAWESRCRGAS